MLVFARQSMGYTSVAGKRVYGEYYSRGSFGHTEITHEDFRKNKNILIEAPITSEWLRDRFDIEFPEVSFTYGKMHEQVEFDTLIEVAGLLGIKFIKGRKSVTKSEKRSLRRAIIRVIDAS